MDTNRLSLEERLKSARKQTGKNTEEIRDPNEIESVLKELCSSPLEKLVIPAEWDCLQNDIHRFEEYNNIFFKQHNVRFIDLIAMTSVDRDDDLCHSDDFAKEGVTDEADISTLSLQRLYRFYMSGLYARIVKFKINTIYDDLMRINYLSLRDYFLDRMQYDINVTFCQSILEKKLLADMTLMDIFDYIRNSVYVYWRPYQSVDKYTQDIRYSFALFNAVFYMPFKVMLNKMYMPDECDEYDYLMRVSFLSK